VDVGNSILDAVNVQAALGQLNLLPLQVADFRGPQAVAVGDQDHGRVAMPIAAALARAVHAFIEQSKQIGMRAALPPRTTWPISSCATRLAAGDRTA